MFQLTKFIQPNAISNMLICLAAFFFGMSSFSLNTPKLMDCQLIRNS